MFSTREEIRFAIVLGSLIIVILVLLIIMAVILYRNRQDRYIKEKRRLQESFSITLLESQLEIHEQTLKTISQEIHDNIGQALSLAKLKLNTVDYTKQEDVQEKITDSKDLVSKSIQDLRDLSRSLNTDTITSMGLLRSIQYELDMLTKSGYKTRLLVQGNSWKMDAQKELIVFRVVQETLNNIIKHAEAKTVNITAAYEEDKLTLSVEDDGKGVDLSPFNDPGHNNSLGIRNMHNRAMMIGADFSMNSTLGKGTIVKLIIPFTNKTS